MKFERTVTMLFAVLAVAACSNTREVAAPVEPLDRLNNIVGKVNRVLISRLHVGGSDGAGFHYECFLHGCGGSGQGFPVRPGRDFALVLRGRRCAGARDRGPRSRREQSRRRRLEGLWRVDGAFGGFPEPLRRRRRERGLFHRVFLRLAFRGAASRRRERHLDWRDGGRGCGDDRPLRRQRQSGSHLRRASEHGRVPSPAFPTSRPGRRGRTSRSRTRWPWGLYDNGRFFGHSGHDDFNQAPIYLDGWFYGSNHAEAAGVFGYHELIGAFGARRQE